MSGSGPWNGRCVGKSSRAKEASSGGARNDSPSSSILSHGIRSGSTFTPIAPGRCPVILLAVCHLMPYAFSCRMSPFVARHLMPYAPSCCMHPLAVRHLMLCAISCCPFPGALPIRALPHRRAQSPSQTYTRRITERIRRAAVRRGRGMRGRVLIAQRMLSEIRVRCWLVWKAVKSVQRVPNRIMTYSTEIHERVVCWTIQMHALGHSTPAPSLLAFWATLVELLLPDV